MERQAAIDLRSIGDVVVDLQRDYPDVTHSTLRFLEREGLVRPVRTKGGHRLYAAADVDRLRTIKEWQARRLSLAEIRHRLAAQAALGEPDDLAARFLAAALAGDPRQGAIVREADELGLPLARIFGGVLRPALVEVGDRWARGELRVGQEHEVSEAVRDLVGDLALRHAHPKPSGRPLLAASVDGDRHDLGLRMVAALLGAAGRRVRFLGADVSARFLLEEAAARRPAAVLLSATLDERLPSLFATADALREATDPPPTIIVGGQVVQNNAAEIRGRGVAVVDDDDLDAAVRAVLDAVGEDAAA